MSRGFLSSERALNKPESALRYALYRAVIEHYAQVPAGKQRIGDFQPVRFRYYIDFVVRADSGQLIAIEIDEPYHRSVRQIEADKERQEVIESEGFVFFRIRSEWVLDSKKLPDVVRAIKAAIQDVSLIPKLKAWLYFPSRPFPLDEPTEKAESVNQARLL